jgi:hypothetical protein
MIGQKYMTQLLFNAPQHMSEIPTGAGISMGGAAGGAPVVLRLRCGGITSCSGVVSICGVENKFLIASQSCSVRHLGFITFIG